jgi:hypothetical protein
MHLYTAEVAIGGERHLVVTKTELTAAEIMVLQTIHGEGSVTRIKKTGEAKYAFRAVMDKLMAQYKRARMRQGGDDGRLVVTTLFNAHSPQLPGTIKDAGVSEMFWHEDDRPREAAKKPTKGKATAAKDANAEPETEVETEVETEAEDDSGLME